MTINYRRGGDAVRKAWFAYQDNEPTMSPKSVCSFLAGWNAAKSDSEPESKPEPKPEPKPE